MKDRGSLTKAKESTPLFVFFFLPHSFFSFFSPPAFCCVVCLCAASTAHFPGYLLNYDKM